MSRGAAWARGISSRESGYLDPTGYSPARSTFVRMDLLNQTRNAPRLLDDDAGSPVRGSNLKILDRPAFFAVLNAAHRRLLPEGFPENHAQQKPPDNALDVMVTAARQATAFSAVARPALQIEDFDAVDFIYDFDSYLGEYDLVGGPAAHDGDCVDGYRHLCCGDRVRINLARTEHEPTRVREFRCWQARHHGLRGTVRHHGQHGLHTKEQIERKNVYQLLSVPFADREESDYVVVVLDAGQTVRVPGENLELLHHFDRPDDVDKSDRKQQSSPQVFGTVCGMSARSGGRCVGVTGSWMTGGVRPPILGSKQR